jgi:hypothetical protein
LAHTQKLEASSTNSVNFLTISGSSPPVPWVGSTSTPRLHKLIEWSGRSVEPGVCWPSQLELCRRLRPPWTSIERQWTTFHPPRLQHRVRVLSIGFSTGVPRLEISTTRRLLSKWGVILQKDRYPGLGGLRLPFMLLIQYPLRFHDPQDRLYSNLTSSFCTAGFLAPFCRILAIV